MIKKNSAFHNVKRLLQINLKYILGTLVRVDIKLLILK